MLRETSVTLEMDVTLLINDVRNVFVALPGRIHQRSKASAARSSKSRSNAHLFEYGVDQAGSGLSTPILEAAEAASRAASWFGRRQAVVFSSLRNLGSAWRRS